MFSSNTENAIKDCRGRREEIERCKAWRQTASEPRRCPVCRARTHLRHASSSGKDEQTDATTADSDPSAPVGGVPRPVIFLSYRRDDVPFAVGLLAARLFGAFPPGDVFLDTMANRRGLFVRRLLRRALARSAVVVSVMGPVWDDERHLSRLADDDDLVRWELETALEQHLPIVPVLVDRDRELSEELPGRLMALHEFAPKALHRETFLGDADALVHRLAGILGYQAEAREPQLQHALASAPPATLDGAIVRRGIDAMLRHVLPLPQQSTRNLEHLVAATASLLEGRRVVALRCHRTSARQALRLRARGRDGPGSSDHAALRQLDRDGALAVPHRRGSRRRAGGASAPPHAGCGRRDVPRVRSAPSECRGNLR